MSSTTISSRIVLFLAAALIACVCLVSAAPITQDLELEAGSSRRINIFKKHDEDEDEESTTTTTTTTTSTKTKKHQKTKTATTTSATATPTTKKSKSSSSSSSSESSGDFSGDATYYNTGLGSCGWTSAESELIVALNHGQMENGANSNDNKLCGKSIKVTNPANGKAVTVKVVDTCPGCANGDVDLSPAAFEKIADFAQGRVPVTWSWA